MNITYRIKNFSEDDEFANIVYTNELQEIYERQVRIPKNSDSSINEELFEEILNSQLEGIKQKYSSGVIKFGSSEYPTE